MKTMFEELKELSKVPPTEMYTVSETMLVKENLKALVEVVEAARKLKILQPSEVKLGEFLVEGWPDLILALRKLDEARRG
jgi:hypothetical protein